MTDLQESTSGAQQTAPAISQAEKEYLWTRIVEEAKFGAQEVRHRCRVTLDSPVSLDAYIARIVGIDTWGVVGGRAAVFDGSNIVVNDLGRDELLSRSVMADIIAPDGKGGYAFTRAKTVVVSARVKVIDGFTEFQMIFQPVERIGDNGLYASVRVSWILPVGPGAYRPETTFFTFDSKAPGKDVDLLGRRRVSFLFDNAWHVKSEPFLRRCMGVMSTEELCARAQQLNEDGHPAAARLYMACAFDHLRTQASLASLSPSRHELFTALCDQLGHVDALRGVCQMASYRYGVAAALASSDDDKRDYAEKARMALRIDEAAGQRGTFAHLVSWMLRLKRRDANGMLARMGQESEFAKGFDNVWSYDYLGLLAKMPTCTDATIAISLVGGGMAMIRAHHMIDGSLQIALIRPALLDQDAVVDGSYDNLVSNERAALISLRFSLAQKLSVDDFENLRDQATRRMADDLDITPWQHASLGIHADEHYLYLRGMAEEEDNCNGNALISYLAAFYGICEKEQAGEPVDDFDREMMPELCFRIGFLLTEIGDFPGALAFLEDVKDGDVRHQAQYIYALVKARDFRALDAIRQRMDACGPGDDEYREYLLRSQIEYCMATSRFEMAKRAVNPLLVSLNPDIRAFAHDIIDRISMLQPLI